MRHTEPIQQSYLILRYHTPLSSPPLPPISSLHRARAEIEAVLMEDQGSPLDVSHLNCMLYTEAALREALRLYPPSATALRRLTKTVILGNHVFEKGWGIIAEPRMTHRTSEYYPRPDDFIPERFLRDSDTVTSPLSR